MREITEETAIDLGLKKEEYSKICELLNRIPNITELAIKFILSKNGISSVFPTVISEEEIENFASMSDGKYLNDSDMAEIDELYNNWWEQNPYELKASVNTA